MTEINILDLIPQRSPFVLVDRLYSVTEDSCTSTFNIDNNHILVDNNSLSAYGLLENMAQTAALLSGYEAYMTGTKPLTGFIGSVSKAQIVELPRIGAQIQTTVTRTTQIMNVIVIEASVFCKEKIMANCTMKIVLMNPAK